MRRAAFQPVRLRRPLIDGAASQPVQRGAAVRSKVTNRRAYRRSATPFVLFHFVPLLAFWTGVTKTALVLLVSLYVLRMLAITCGYHRYFSHRTYRMNRAMQFVVGFIGTTAAQRGPIWWA